VSSVEPLPRAANCFIPNSLELQATTLQKSLGFWRKVFYGSTGRLVLPALSVYARQPRYEAPAEP
jgi:hypothetical protein